MEEITRRSDVLYYGKEPCQDIDDAYRKFREDYNRAAGRQSFLRIDKVGQRVERGHGFGFNFSTKMQAPERLAYGDGRLPIRLLGILCTSYCWITGCWYYQEISDENFEFWFDGVFAKENLASTIKRCGLNQKTGRTAKRFRKTFK